MRNIEAGKKADIRVVISTDNSTKDGNKVTDQHAGIAGLTFAAVAIANSAGNFNLAIPEGTPLGITTFISNKFFDTFAAFANTTLGKKSNVYEFNPFLFAVHC